MRTLICLTLLSAALARPFQMLGNNITVTNPSILRSDCGAGPNNPDNFSMVSFDLRWENSWRTSTGPANWDAAWVFIKFQVGTTNPQLSGARSSGTTVTVSSTSGLRVGMPVRVIAGTGALAAGTTITSIVNGTQFVVSASPTTALTSATIECQRIWEHAWLNNTGHVAAAGSTVEPGLLSPGTGFNPSTNPALGAFVYRSADGTGTNTFNGLQLRWNYARNGVTDSFPVSIQVYAIEMVHVPQGGFFVGTGGSENSSFTWANSTTGSPLLPFWIGSTSITLQANGFNAGNLPTNLSVRGASNIDLTGTTTASLASFPVGFNAFYCMKYELTQGQYRDFLNSLSRIQQANRVGTTISVGTTSVTNRFVMSNNSTIANIARNGIRCDATIDANNPVAFYCDLNNNGVGNEAADGEWLACNWLSWLDGAAYLDWAGLRPMTELEFEKACRGNQIPVMDEYAWGTASVAASTYTINNAGRADEGIASNYSLSGNAVYITTWGGNNGPLRVGIFAAHPTNTSRLSSGASFYGILELSGNLVERTVTVGNVAGRSYTGVHGDGSLLAIGAANVASWPGMNGNSDPNTANGSTGGVTDGAGSGLRGGSVNQSEGFMRVSDRQAAAPATSQISRTNNFGFRGVRTQ